MASARFLCSLAIFGSWSGCYGQAHQDLRPDQIYARVSPSVIRITSRNAGGVATGTGFLIGKTGVAVTTYSLVQGATNASAKLADGKTVEVSGIIDFNKLRNIALIKLRASSTSALRPTITSLVAGAKVYTIGAADGANIGISDGIVKLITTSADVKQIQVTCATGLSSGGGPLLNSKGEVVGIIVYQLTPGHPDVAVPSSYIDALNATLAVKPWGQSPVASNQAKPTKQTWKTKPKTDPELSLEDSISEYDLANAIVDEADGVNIVYEQYLINAIEGTYANGPDESLTNAQNALEDDNTAMSQIEFDDSAMEAARKDVVLRMATLLKDMAQVESAIKTAQLSGGWIDDASKLASAAENEASDIRGDGSIEKLIKKKSFQEILPHYYLETQGLIADPSGIRLGIASLVLDPLFIVYVDPKGLAAKLNISNLERIEEFNGKKPKDIDDLKGMIKLAAGEDVTIKIQDYFGVESLIQVTEPVNLGP
jgi:hypothetical protein